MADGSNETGAKLVYLECEKDGTLTDETLKAGINENTKIVAVGQVSNVLGCVNPVKKIAAMAHAVGAVMVVDAAQSAPHMKIDVKDLDADFLAFSGHKLMGPMGYRCALRQAGAIRKYGAIYDRWRNDRLCYKRGCCICRTST